MINATRDLCFTPKSGIANEDRSVSEELHAKVLANVTPEVGFVMQLQRLFGLRFREAALLDATKVLEALHQGSVPMLVKGTKGGQPRPLADILMKDINYYCGLQSSNILWITILSFLLICR